MALGKPLTRCSLLFGMLLALSACSGDEAQPDSGSADGGSGLWECNSPGTSCNAHDSCVLSAVCGEDRLCHPTKRQNCDDGLDCTEDTCAGLGVCRNTAKPGTCALPVRVEREGKLTTELRCFEKGEHNPSDVCQFCNPGTDGGDPNAWGLAEGGDCDDKDPCTKDDYCQAGVCTGTKYSCADKLACTEDLCDGHGGCSGQHSLLADWCLIGGTCYKDQAQGGSNGCDLCDVKTSQTAWTPLQGGCQIGGQCYLAGAKDSSGCKVCDPVKDPANWTAVSGVCQVDGICYKAGTLNPGANCAECDPAEDPAGWTVKGDECLIGGVCYKPGAKDLSGCGSCDPSHSKSDWTTLADTCRINNQCFSVGTKDSTTCGECDPSVSDKAWTVKGDVCLIGATCYQPGQTSTSGCGSCDPSLSKTDWTPVQGKCAIGPSCFADGEKHSSNCLICEVASDPSGWTPLSSVSSTVYDFEDGKSPPTGWTTINTAPPVGWVVSDRRPKQGSYSLYYGDPAAGNYATALDSSGTATLPAITLPAGKQAALSFSLYMDVRPFTFGFIPTDVLTVTVNGFQVWARDPATPLKSWQEIAIDLSSYAGQKVTIGFDFQTIFPFPGVDTEGVFIDSVAVYQDC